MSHDHSPHGAEPNRKKGLSETADELEHKLAMELEEKIITRSVLYTSGERDPTGPKEIPFGTLPPGRHVLQGDDPRLKKMPKNPTLMDFFKYRFSPPNHLLQSARLAQKSGHNEKVITACLLHDIAVDGFIRSDHGYWGAQLVEPYVDEEVSWAIKTHQALRFFPDESVGYGYPDYYRQIFGDDFEVEPYIREEYERARNHKWYMTSRLVCLNDLYAFDPNVVVKLEDFTDIIGRNFKQPKEGLGFDGSSVAHMWRTMIWPTKWL
jgi:HD domain-containing protein